MLTSAFIPGNKDYSEAKDIRKEVFIEEQKCTEEDEFDEYDEDAMHLMIYIDEEPAATGRIWYDGRDFRIGRIAVRKKYRGQRIGDLAVRLLLYKAFNSGAETVNINAQVYIMQLYKKFGFKAHGEEFTEAGRPHYAMSVGREEVVYPSDCCKK